MTNLAILTNLDLDIGEFGDIDEFGPKVNHYTNKIKIFKGSELKTGFKIGILVSFSQLPLLANIILYWLRELAQYGSVYSLGSTETRIGPALLGEYFLVLPIWQLNIFLCCQFGSFKSSLGNSLCLEGNIATACFQYSIVR